MSKKMSLVRMKNKLQIDPDKMDKYLEHYHNGTPLDGEGVMMLERYRKAWSWLSMGRPYESIISMLMKEYGLQERQARYIISESVFLHGNVNHLDKAGKKVASANFFRMVANLALMERDYDAATKAWEKADKLEGLNEEEEAGWDPDAFSKPSKIVFINNVNVLQQHLKKQMEDDE
ncbi:hypothetical protein [Spirosoma endbachense]|uniref:Uncharacterized protein n=1 Tax=Spirosoma endbachense TaxID=2666025 RepID=A0A6P1VZ98_9BACT|nr:hypothetical protein [Spirosoma endbachense]QHV97954.1 hypothetical protein GJR95_24390 [Spirosoma endbachense]